VLAPVKECALAVVDDFLSFKDTLEDLTFLSSKDSLAKANGNILLAEVYRHYILDFHYFKSLLSA
jgi:hypothetical protein